MYSSISRQNETGRMCIILHHFDRTCIIIRTDQLNHSISLGFNLHLHCNLFLSQTLVHNIYMLKITYIKLLILTITSRNYYLKEHTRKGLSKKKKKHVLCYSGFLWLGRCHTRLRKLLGVRHILIFLQPVVHLYLNVEGIIYGLIK